MWNIINDDPIIGWHRKEETMTSDISVKTKTDFKGTIHISGSHTYCIDLSVDSGTHSLFFSWKLSPPNNLPQIWFEDFLSFTVWKNYFALQVYKYISY